MTHTFLTFVGLDCHDPAHWSRTQISVCYIFCKGCGHDKSGWNRMKITVLPPLALILITVLMSCEGASSKNFGATLMKGSLLHKAAQQGETPSHI